MNTITEPSAIATVAAKARAKVASAEREAATLEALAAAWPADRPVRLAVDVGSYFAISAEVPDRAAAAAYLEAFDLEPIAYAKGTFTTVKPLAWFKPDDLENAREAITDDLIPAVWNYGHGEAEVRAWPRLAPGVRVQLTLRIAQDPAQHVVEYDRPERRDRRIMRDELHGAPNGEGIRWSGAGHPRTFTVYFYQEPGGGAPTLADLLDVRGRVL